MSLKRLLPALLALLLTASAAAGCSQKTAVLPSPAAAASPLVSPTLPLSPTSSAPASVEPEETQSYGIVTFATLPPIGTAPEDFLALLKTPENEKAALEQLRRTAPGLPASDAAAMFLALEDYQTKAVKIGTILSGDLVMLLQAPDAPQDEKALNELMKIEDPRLVSALQAVFERGYRLIFTEGTFEAILDYDTYISIEPALPPDLAAYIEIMATNSRQRMAEDAALIIPLDEVAKRALVCEDFLSVDKYASSVRSNNVRNLFSTYVLAYFLGLDNTPAFDRTTKKLNQEFLDSYKNTDALRPATPISIAISKYLKVLESSNYVLNDEVVKAQNVLANLILTLCYG